MILLNRTLNKVIFTAAILVMTVSVSLLMGLPAFAVDSFTEDLMKIGVGARPMGMGKAFVGVADDADSIFVNPSGLASMNKYQFISMYSTLFDGELPYMLMAFSNPFSFGTLGIGVLSTGTSQIPSPNATGINYFDYSDRLVVLSYANKVLGKDNFLFGSNIKFFQKGFGGSVSGSGTGTDMDLGFFYTPDHNISYGLNLQNVLSSKLQWDTGATDTIPTLIKMGISYKPLKNLLTAFDLDFSPERTVPTLGHIGCELSINKNVSVRAGIDELESAGQVSNNLTAGASLYLDGLRIDYAYHFYKDLPTSASHFVSIAYSPSDPIERERIVIVTREAAKPVVPQSKTPTSEGSLKDIEDIQALISELMTLGYVDNDLNVTKAFLKLRSSDDMKLSPKFRPLSGYIYKLLKQNAISRLPAKGREFCDNGWNFPINIYSDIRAESIYNRVKIGAFCSERLKNA